MRLYYFLLGFVRVFIPDELRADAISALLRRGLAARMDQNGNILVPFFKRKRYFSALKKIDYEIVESGGIPVILMNIRHRAGIFAALALVIAIYIFSSFYIWDIRIDGNENIPDSVILNELSNVGFGVGRGWGSITRSDAEWAFLEASQSIGWININRRGSVAYVTVKEKTVPPQDTDAVAFSNIVAARDCIIEEISVRAGVAAVKVGDTVRAGDLLISGVLPGESGGGFVAADGVVLGRVSEEISVEVPKTESDTVLEGEKLYSSTLKIFNFRINIFKRYGKKDKGCAIIEDVKEYTLLGKYRIPISLERIYAAESRTVQRRYTDGELANVALSRLSALRAMALRDAELMKIRTHGEYTDTGYKLTSQVTVLSDVGERRIIVAP